MNIRFKTIMLLCPMILCILSSICFASPNYFPWDSPMEKFIGTVDAMGNLDTSGALFTDILPRIITGIMIVSATYMYMTGQLNAEKVTIMRIIFSAGMILNLSLYFNQNFFDVSYSSKVASVPENPDPTRADFLSVFMTYFIWLCQAGAERMYPYIMKIMIGFAALSVVSTLFFKLEDDIIKYLVKTTITIGFYMWLISNWIGGIGIAHTLYSTFETLGFIAAGEEARLMPDSIVSNAFVIISEAIERISLADGPVVMIISLIMVIITIVCVVIIAIQLFMVRIEFWVMAVLCMPCLMFAPLKHTRFMFEKGIGSMFNASMKLLVVTFILTIVNPILTFLLENYKKAEGAENLSGLLQIMIGCVVLVMMVIKIPQLVQALLSGSPSLSAGDALAPIQAANQAAERVGRAYNAGARGMALLKAASQMEGGREARGVPGLKGTLSKAAGQIRTGQTKGLAETLEEYGAGGVGTFANAYKLMREGKLKGAYHRELSSLRENQKDRSKNRALGEAYSDPSNEDNKEIINDNIEAMKVKPTLDIMQQEARKKRLEREAINDGLNSAKNTSYNGNNHENSNKP